MPKQVTLARGGTAERTLNLRDVKIPDLWHTVEAIRIADGRPIALEPGTADVILECWNIAHQLRREWLRENGEEPL